MNNSSISIFWFRRDLRLYDNAGLSEALKRGHAVVPLFIFDKNIISELDKRDARVTFIHRLLENIHTELKKTGSGLLVKHGDPIQVWKQLVNVYNISAVYTNKDYEPYAIKRDNQVSDILMATGIDFYSFKDQVIFEEQEVMKDDASPYTVFTPYKKKWLSQFTKNEIQEKKVMNENLFSFKSELPTLSEIGFERSTIEVKPVNYQHLAQYQVTRDYPSKDATSYLSPHLRFGSVSVREVIRNYAIKYEAFLSELIWREFFMQILFHFPEVVKNNFKKKYDAVQWRNDKGEFRKWCKGETGYPLVDAGMKQLNKTGYMHNRVRMITASFLCKHLLIDWRWGEAYFAKKLLDYEISANNGNWQWVAGTGCDASPYFRIFNPVTQLKKFDKDLIYVKKWLQNFDTENYIQPMVDHKFARTRALAAYQIINK